MSESPAVTPGPIPTPPGITPLMYGELQGTFMGVPALSNRDDGFFSGENNFVSHLILTGYRYQCVEYARRFLLLTVGCVIPNCGKADEIFDMREILHVETGKKYDLIPHPNKGTTRRPVPGDIIVYPYNPTHAPWGHVGVISYVSDSGVVGIADQNHFFGPFVSPSPDYRDGERCVAHYADLTLQDDGTWYLRDRGEDDFDCCGWMSYPDAPRRESLNAPLVPLPSALKARSSPLEQADHPSVTRFRLNRPIRGTASELQTVYLMQHGSGETFVGAITATARIIRLVLQLLFDRMHHDHQFILLPTNPRAATARQPSDALDALIGILKHPDVDNAAIDAALAQYFTLPLPVVEAMRRGFNHGNVHAPAICSFALECGMVIPDDPEAVAAAANGGPVTSKGWKCGKTHDEAWQLCYVDYSTPTTIVDLDQLRSVGEEFKPILVEHSPVYKRLNHHVVTSEGFKVDLARFVLAVESRCGKQRAISVILPAARNKLPPKVAQYIDVLVKYQPLHSCPIEEILEDSLHYDNATHVLSGTTTAGVAVPSVTFCYLLREWSDLLTSEAVEHHPLVRAVVDKDSVVTFAQPLWTCLASGPVSEAASKLRGPLNEAGEGATRRSILFYDLCRRIFDYAEPKQAPETWSQEVSEYKGSCRRVHLRDVAPAVDEADTFLLKGVMVNSAWSCGTAAEYAPDLGRFIPATAMFSIAKE